MVNRSEIKTLLNSVRTHPDLIEGWSAIAPTWPIDWERTSSILEADPNIEPLVDRVLSLPKHQSCSWRNITNIPRRLYKSLN